MQQQQQYYEDDDTIETVEEQRPDELQQRQHAVFIKIRKDHNIAVTNKSSTPTCSDDGDDSINNRSFELFSRQYQLLEESLDRSWFDRKIVHNSRTDLTTTSPVSKLCGIPNLQIYYRKDEEQERQQNENIDTQPQLSQSSYQSKSKKRARGFVPSNHPQQQQLQKKDQHQKQSQQQKRKLKRRRRPINKMATLLTFDSDTGLYGQLIRGNAYVVVGGCGDDNTSVSVNATVQVQILQDVLELIFQYKTVYHKWGADFSQDGRTKLLKACEKYNRRHLSISDKNKKEPQVQQEQQTIQQQVEPQIQVQCQYQESMKGQAQEEERGISNADEDGSNNESDRSTTETLSSLNENSNLTSSISLSPFSKLRKSNCENPEYKDFVATATSNSSDSILESFELEADDILFSFQNEVQSMLAIECHHQATISELSMNSASGDHVTTAARTKNVDNINSLGVAIDPEIEEEGHEEGTNRKNSDDLFQLYQANINNRSTAIDENDEPDNNNNNNSNKLLSIRESLYPDSHLRSVFGIDDPTQDELYLTRRFELLQDEIKTKVNAISRKDHHVVVATSKATPPPSPFPFFVSSFESVYDHQILPGIVVRRLSSI